MITRGSYVRKPMVNFSGPQNFYFMQISQNIDDFRQNKFHKAFRIHENL